MGQKSHNKNEMFKYLKHLKFFSMTYLKQNRKKFFPMIEDFSDPQNELRNKENKDQTTLEWFWFNPFAYTYFVFAIPSWLLFCNFLVSCYLIYSKSYIMIGFSLIPFFFIVKFIRANWIIRSEIKGKNFYDMFIRD